MKILIVHPCKGFYGGAEEVIVQFNRYLREHYHDITIVTKDAPIEMLKGVDYSYNCKSYVEMASYTRYFSGEVDIICCFNYPATLATLGCSTPVVWYCNEPPELFTNWKRSPLEAFHRNWIGRKDIRCVVADGYNKERFQRIYKRIPDVVPYGIDYNFWSGVDSFTNIGDSFKEKNNIKLLQVGTISKYKNQIESILTLMDLLDMGIDCTLTLLGNTVEEDYYSQIINFIESEGISARILIKGHKTKNAVRVAYHCHDILLHPVKEQGGWLVPFEAMCAKIPVIVSSQLPAAGTIEHFRLGLVGYASEFILRGEQDSIDLNRSAEWVKDYLSWEKFGDSMMKIFENHVGESR